MLTARTQKSVAAMLLIATLLVSGCGEIASHAVIHHDGSVDLVITAHLPEAASPLLASEEMLTLLKSYLTQHDLRLEETTTSQGVELKATGHWAQAASLLSIIASSTPTSVPGSGSLQVTPGILLDGYRCQLNLDCSAWATEQLTGWQLYLAKLAFGRTKLTLQVTLPWAAKEHNADFVEQQGRTLGWRVDLAQPRCLQVLMMVPNRNAWLAISCLLTLTFVTGVRSFWRWTRRAKSLR